MQHGMAVGANGSEIAYGIDFIFFVHFCKREYVMHMDIVLSEFAVGGLK